MHVLASNPGNDINYHKSHFLFEDLTAFLLLYQVVKSIQFFIW